jgi:regulator of PEP synthase PpsR (kinase-PPPase family)
MDKRIINVHLVSDSTGETVSSICRSVMTQFEEMEVEEHIWSLVRTQRQIEKVIEGVKTFPGIVMYTLVQEELNKRLEEECKKLKTPCIPVLEEVLMQVSGYLGQKRNAKPGRQHQMDAEYFARVEAINYTLQHDDGQQADDLEEADVVLVGVSRTSKSPTCVYLSYRGFKAANIPFVRTDALPENLSELKNPMVVGLVISPERLIQIRKTRLNELNENKQTSYVDAEAVEAEVREARRLFSKNNWPVIDVTRRSVEETAANIIQLINERKIEKEKAE